MTDDLDPDVSINEVADALIEAQGHAVEGGDKKLLELIGGAVLHVGHRLASESRKIVDPIEGSLSA